MQEVLNEISSLLGEGNTKRVRTIPEKVRQAIDQGADPVDILQKGLLSGMEVLGVLFRDDEVFIPEVLFAAKMVNQSMELLQPLLVGEGAALRGKILLGTVQGDLHDIGKHLVGIMLEGSGWEVIDLGMDVSAESFVEAAKEHGVSLVGLSALLTTTMGEMSKVIEAFRTADMDTKIIVGGAPITQEFADQIGADGFAANAVDAVDVFSSLACKGMSQPGAAT